MRPTRLSNTQESSLVMQPLTIFESDQRYLINDLVVRLRTGANCSCEQESMLIGFIRNTEDLSSLWLAVCGLHLVHKPHRHAEVIFDACCRLRTSSSEFLRLAAYRWLSRLHTLDLRYEIVAQKLLKAALKQEAAVLQKHLKTLLRAS